MAKFPFSLGQQHQQQRRRQQRRGLAFSPFSILFHQRPCFFLDLLFLLFLHLLPQCTAQPMAALLFQPLALSTPPPVYTTNGGRNFSTFTFPTTLGVPDNFTFAMASPTGGASVMLTTSPVSGLTTVSMWDSIGYTWRSVPSGLPAYPSGLAVVGGDVSINRAAWLSVVDASSGTPTMYEWSNGAVPFYAPPDNATLFPLCATPMGVVVGLPSTNALGAMDAPPYHVTLWRGGSPTLGCQGTLDLVNGTTHQVWSMAYSFTSITHYTVIVAGGPIGCGGGASCPGSAGGRLYVSPVSPSSAGDDALLSPSAWSSFPMPDGGGVNILACLDDTFLTINTYCYALASWQPPGYTGACSALTSGYPVYAALENATTLVASQGAWRAVGCVPVLPQSLAVSDAFTLHVGGLELGGLTYRVVYSADSGVSWRTLSPLPPSLTTPHPGSLGGALGVFKMSLRGGPVQLSGMDPSWHCQSNNVRPATLTAFQTFSTATFLTYKDCNSVMLIANSTMSYATRGDGASAAVLGTYVPSPPTTLNGNSYIYWATVRGLGWNGTWWSNSYASASQVFRGGTLDEFFSRLAWGDINPSLIIISEVLKAANGIQQRDMGIIDANVLKLARFVNTGGGLYSAGFQGPNGAVTPLNYGYLSVLTPRLALANASGSGSVALTPVGSSQFPQLKTSDIASPWHTSFGGAGYGACGSCSFGVLNCLAWETLAGTPQCALVGGNMISFSYGTVFQTIICAPITPPGPFWGYFGAASVPVTCYATSGLSVSIATNTSSACAFTYGSLGGYFNTGVVNATAAGGRCTLVVSQGGDEVYAAATHVVLSMVFGPLSPSPRATLSGSMARTPSIAAPGTATPSPSRSPSSTIALPTPSACASLSPTITNGLLSGTQTQSRSVTMAGSGSLGPGSPSPSPSSSRSPSTPPSPSRSPSTSPSARVSVSTPPSISLGVSTLSPSPSTSRSPSASPSLRPSGSNPFSQSLGSTFSPSPSLSRSPSTSITPSRSPSSSGSTSRSGVGTPSKTASHTLSINPTGTPPSVPTRTMSVAEGTGTGSATMSRSPSRSSSGSGTPSLSRSSTLSPSVSGNPSFSESPMGTTTRGLSWAVTATSLHSPSTSGSPSPSPAASLSPSFSASPTPFPSPSTLPSASTCASVSRVPSRTNTVNSPTQTPLGGGGGGGEGPSPLRVPPPPPPPPHPTPSH